MPREQRGRGQRGLPKGGGSCGSIPPAGLGPLSISQELHWNLRNDKGRGCYGISYIVSCQLCQAKN